MPHGELIINGLDAYDTWGISLSTTSLSALMTPPPMKAMVENQNRLEHGKKVLNHIPRENSREIVVIFNLTAPTEEVFFERYSYFCTHLLRGDLDIKTKYQPNTVYRMKYISCSQFTQFMRGIASFSLKLLEPDPSYRRDSDD